MAEPVASSSLVPGAPLRELGNGRALAALRFVGGARGLTLSASLLAHAAVAVLAAHHLRPAHALLAEASLAAPIEVVDTEVVAEGANEPVAVTPKAPAARAAEPPRAAYRAAMPTAHADSAATGAPDGIAAPAPAARFAMTVAAVSNTPTAATSITNAASSSSQAAAAPVPESAVDAPARLLVGTTPGYTAAAQAAGVEADVPLEIVIDGAGAVQSARGLARVGYGLDEAALSAVRGFRFSAARRAGAAVAVRMRWLMRFQLR